MIEFAPFPYLFSQFCSNYHLKHVVTMVHLQWPSFLAKVVANINAILLGFATFGGTTLIGTLLLVSRHPR